MEELKDRPMTGLSAWAVIVGIVGIIGIVEILYEVAVDHIEHSFYRLVGLVFGVWIWAPLAIQTIRRQGLSPKWFWVIVGTVGGPLVLVPIWHHGREWKSTRRKVVGWLFFVAVVAFSIWAWV